MKNYIDQAVAVCDAIIAQAKENREHYNSVFAPVSPYDEKLRIEAEINKQEKGVSLGKLQKEYAGLHRDFVEKLNKTDRSLRKRFERKSDMDRATFIQSLRLNYPDLDAEYTKLAHTLEQLHEHERNQAPALLEEHLNGIADLIKKEKTTPPAYRIP